MNPLLPRVLTLRRTSFRDPDAELGCELSAFDALGQCYAIADRVGNAVDLHAARELVENLLHLAHRQLAQNIVQDLDLARIEPFRKFEVTTTTGIPRRLVPGFRWRLAWLWC